jgi:hypothetical protein
MAGREWGLDGSGGVSVGCRARVRAPRALHLSESVAPVLSAPHTAPTQFPANMRTPRPASRSSTPYFFTTYIFFVFSLVTSACAALATSPIPKT